jgi:2,3-bisphosphoglycerate-independent phosphoglycerate mutase
LFTTKTTLETLGEVLEKANKTQIRIAETEKYPHVFFSGGEKFHFR